MRNVEARRCAIERYGAERFLRDSQAEKVHSDDYGELYRKKCVGEQLSMVKVVNASPEQDGSFKDYFLRVPPEMTTAREAVAWTFGLEGEEMRYYDPMKQT